MYILINI